MGMANLHRGANGGRRRRWPVSLARARPPPRAGGGSLLFGQARAMRFRLRRAVSDALLTVEHAEYVYYLLSKSE
ncbi:hypothetical protein GCM10010252_04530 [Streptomyces aureoverticillatus]|nr:hypothetical protein GCM10010252_04530 [Streptomyces aureoverticillatus]